VKLDPEIVVRCHGLTKKYQEITALEGLDLAIPRGHIFGYIGHNGAGKTTTIRILAGLLEPTSGKATIAGLDVTSARDRVKSLVGYMPDSFGVYEQMRVWEYLDFFGAAFKIPKAKRRQRIDYVLDLTDSQYMRDRFVDTLSKGMKQRIGIARTLMHDPQVLLLDEPANGLDPQARIHMRQLLRKLADAGKTLIVSSHILPELAAVCDSVGIIHQGHLKACGPIQQVLGQIQRDRLMEVKLLVAQAFQPVQQAVQAQTPAEHGLERTCHLCDHVAKALADHARCSKIDSSDAADGILRFRFSGDDAALADLVAGFGAWGGRIVTVREVPLSLEEAYMAVSGISSATGHADADEEEQARIEHAKARQAAVASPQGKAPRA
jgi:ABC-2 type transport system ATP-binding protein